ncbi:MAG TPA: hypothetical protein PKG95_09620, partial [Anaerolineaceae bacterium]|nr:hypothetical protein [Anaerolineaceae bacterium]
INCQRKACGVSAPINKGLLQGLLVGAVSAGLMGPVSFFVMYQLDLADMTLGIFTENVVTLILAMESIDHLVRFTILNLIAGSLCGRLIAPRLMFKYRFLIVSLVAMVSSFLGLWIWTPEILQGRPWSTDACLILINGSLFILLYGADLIFKPTNLLLGLPENDLDEPESPSRF